MDKTQILFNFTALIQVKTTKKITFSRQPHSSTEWALVQLYLSISLSTGIYLSCTSGPVK